MNAMMKVQESGGISERLQQRLRLSFVIMVGINILCRQHYSTTPLTNNREQPGDRPQLCARSQLSLMFFLDKESMGEETQQPTFSLWCCVRCLSRRTPWCVAFQ